jgi:hypothetical protein
MGEGQMCTIKCDLDLSVTARDLKDRVDAHIHENRRFVISQLHKVFSYVS